MFLAFEDRRKTIQFPEVFLLLMIAALTACSNESLGQGSKANPKKGMSVPVIVSPAVQKNMPIELHAIGNVQAYYTVVIKSQVEGTLMQVHFKEGQEVKKGELLFSIDPRPFEVQRKQAEANLARDQAQAENARREANRYEQLLQKDYVSQEQYEQLRATAAAFEGTLLADQAAVEQAKLQLEYCSIRSPIDGIAGNLLVHPGNLVKQNDADHPLVTINQMRPIYVVFSIPELNLSEIQKYRVGAPLLVEATISNAKALPVIGKLTFVDNTVDTVSGTIQLKAVFPNDGRTLWPGQFVNVVLTLTTEPNAIVIPSQAVQTGQQGPYVFVINSDLTVEHRSVVVGRTVGGEAVISQGLTSNERVVTDGQLRLTPGVKVEIKTSISPTVVQEETP
jgi:multidrug efflux system membrane fusion protein